MPGVAAATMFILLTSASADVGTTPEAASSVDDQVIQNLQEQVRRLQGEVDQLKAANDGQWMTQQRSDEIRGLVQDVLADADTRASLLQSGATAGWDNGFFLGSADGNYLLRIGGQLQVRYVYNHQNDSPTDDNRYGFEIRRAKLDFKGHVFDPSWQYQFELDASRNGGTVTLGENGWIQKDMGNGLKVRFGQFKPLFTREESISSRRLQEVERSQVNTQFTAGTAQGVQALYEADKWRVAGSLIDGANTANTAWSTEDNEYAFTSRFEFLAAGDWKAMEDDIGFRGGPKALMFGVGALFQNQEYGTGNNLPLPDFNNAEVQNLTLTGDITWKMSGFSLAGEIFYRHLSTDATSIELDQFGVVLSGGYFIRDDVELYAMYEWGELDIPGQSDLSILTVGFTMYFNKHNLKWQNDIGYGFNPVAASWAVDSAGWRPDAPGENGQIVVRSQFQLLF